MSEHDKPGRSRSIYIRHDLWDKAKARADAEGLTMAALVRKLLIEYVNRGRKK
jgi:hypothetical protein